VLQASDSCRLRGLASNRSNSKVPISVPAASQRTSLRSPAELVGSPEAIRWVIPLLVAITGAIIAFLGQRSLRASNEELTRSRFVEETAMVADSVGEALATADPLMDRFVQYVQSSGVTIDGTLRPERSAAMGDLSHEMASIVRAHQGVVYASVSYPNGAFIGSFMDGEKRLIAQVSRAPGESDGVLGPGKVTRLDLVGTAGLRERETVSSSYDPRKRPFYILAAEKRARAWTDPYVFYDNKFTGITRTEPIYAKGVLACVLTIDFDVHTLSRLVTARQGTTGVSMVLHTDDGTLLALPEAMIPPGAASEHPLRYQDVSDLGFSTFFTKPVTEREGWHELTGTQERLLTLSSPVKAIAGSSWAVTAFIPESIHSASFRRHQFRSLLALGVALLFSVMMGSLAASYLQRAQRKLKEAEEDARNAESRAAKAEGVARQLGSYELVQRLGLGGMGEVWRATHRLLPRDAAVKLIRADSVDADTLPELQMRFRREARTMAQLRCRSTVSILDYGIAADGSLFLVMELLEGVDLSRMMKLVGPMPVERMLTMMNQICASLAEAHALGIVHRDIKPANVFLARVGDEVDLVKVLDFGLVHLARIEEPVTHTEEVPPVLTIQMSERAPASLPSTDDANLTQAGASLGTPSYMAPEQVLGHAVSPATDVYALGVLMVFMITGRLLFERAETHAVMMAHVVDAVPDFETWTAHKLPAALSALIRTCLEKKPESRPKDAGELRASLRAIEEKLAIRWTEERAHALWATLPKAEVELAAAADSEDDSGTGARLTIAEAR
jgi:serine/threonine protein kinase